MTSREFFGIYWCFLGREERAFEWMAIFRSLCDFVPHCLHSNSLTNHSTLSEQKEEPASFPEPFDTCPVRTTRSTLMNERGEKSEKEAIFHRTSASQGEECGVGISRTKKKRKNHLIKHSVKQNITLSLWWMEVVSFRAQFLFNENSSSS